MLYVVLAIYGVMSIVTLVLYRWDKRCAGRGRRRIAERTLHLLALLCGWPGAVVAQQLFKHKRRKPGFMLITGLIGLAHAAAWAVTIRLWRD